jgi:hypothetical protein
MMQQLSLQRDAWRTHLGLELGGVVVEVEAWPKTCKSVSSSSATACGNSRGNCQAEGTGGGFDGMSVNALAGWAELTKCRPPHSWLILQNAAYSLIPCTHLI